MNIKDLIRFAILMTTAALVFGCGGGGGGGGGGGAQSTVVSGVAQAGLIKSGTVQVYGINDDGSLTDLGHTTTNDNGSYQLNVGAWTKPIIVKVYGGTYLDEASGQTIPGPQDLDHALSAALPSVSGSTVKVPVTPLTDIAVRKAVANGTLDATKIAAANQAVTDLFGVDITNIIPAPPTTADMQGSTMSSDQKKYTAVLATLSQYAANIASGTPAELRDALQDALAQISSGITSSAATSSPEVALKLQQAADAIKTNPSTRDMITAAGTAASDAIQTLSTIGTESGTQIKSYTVKATGSGSNFGSVKVSITLPAGVTIRTDATTGEMKNGAIVASGMATGSQVSGAISSNVVTLVIVDPYGFSSGEVATLYADVAGTPPAGSAFTPITVIQAYDPSGETDVTGNISIQVN